ncbi:MAG: vWA domain-containing protein [Isosphaerales bacterium]
MDLRPPASSADDNVYQLVVHDQPASALPLSPVPANGERIGGDVAAAPAGPGLTDQTMVVEPVVIGQDIRGAVGAISAAATVTQSLMSLPTDAEEAGMAIVPGSPAVPAGASGPESSPRPGPRGSNLRPRRRRRVRLRYLIQAWGVSLVVHVAILSVLAAATFTSQDAIKKILNFDSALASYANGEQESLPIYADPDNIPRDRAIGNEHASTPGEPALVVAGEGEGEEGGGVIVASGVGSGRPSNTPRVRGVGKGRINEGSSMPGVKVDGLGGSPLTLLPVAPAADLGGGGMIAGDPIFEVKEIGVALDQLAREILRHLRDHKLTVVWLFDESISMQDDQKAILEKFDRVSSELKLNVEPSKKSALALTHAVVGFGQGIDYVLEKPREDIDQIGRAIKHLKVDSTGIENTMHAIREVVEHYANLIRKDRRLLIVLVTDESGDDGTDIEEARQALKKYKVPLYVIGRQSLFGYPYAHHRYVDPVTKDVYHPMIRRGPETADLELYQWDGLYDRWDEQPSGFAPYELARLTKDSGGIYFVLPSEEFMRIRQREQAYSITRLKEYLPEYDNRLTYMEKRNSSPMRQLLHAIVLEGKNFIYLREFPIEPPKMVQAALEEGEKATIKLNALLDIQKRLEDHGKMREREPEKRWQAHFDLMLAQTVAFQVKAYEYRALMASIAKAPPVPKGQPRADLMITWVVNHSKKPLAPLNQTAKKYAEAERRLKEVIVRHPKTPWADLAQDALDRGFSVQLDEWHHNPNYYERAQFVPKY